MTKDPISTYNTTLCRDESPTFFARISNRPRQQQSLENKTVKVESCQWNVWATMRLNSNSRIKVKWVKRHCSTKDILTGLCWLWIPPSFLNSIFMAVHGTDYPGFCQIIWTFFGMFVVSKSYQGCACLYFVRGCPSKERQKPWDSISNNRRVLDHSF